MKFKTKCPKCSYQGKGKGIKAQEDDILEHIKKEHPELRPFKL